MLTLLCITLKNGQAYFKNLVAFTPQDLKSTLMHERVKMLRCFKTP